MSFTTVLNFVDRQVKGMMCSTFEIGIRDENSGDTFIRTWSIDTLLKPKTIGFLRLENSKKKHIYIRPIAPHPLSLIDDLCADTIKLMKSDGFRPSVIVETSPGNYQAWLCHGEVLAPTVSTAAAQMLADKYGGDLSSADYRHFGRLAGFTNPKPKYIDENGYSPFSRLIQVTGKPYREAASFLLGVKEKIRIQEAAVAASCRSPSKDQFATLLDIESFHRNSKYRGDLHRADLAFAIYALSRNMDELEIEEQLLRRDLNKKGNQSRQADYVKRTIQKAKAFL